MTVTLTLPSFIARWQATSLSERSAAQSHFIDLCRVLGQPEPVATDPAGSFYTFEKGVEKIGGGQGFADVWLKGHFAWEYKGKHKSLIAAYQQLLKYREDLENPPLLVVCDLDRFEIHTNFTGTAKFVYRFSLADLAKTEPLGSTKFSALEVLRLLFTDPERLRPEQTTAQVTEAAAKEFAKLAVSLRKYGADPEKSAHFLMRLLFCLFAEDIGLLPANLFTKLVDSTVTRPDDFTQRLSALSGAMATGGFFGPDDIRHFNGGLFAGSQTLDLIREDLEVLQRACRLDWASIEPAIFGTLFERSLDPSKRSQLGAHYTSKDDILLIIEPVLMAPLRREWSDIQQQVQGLVAKLTSARGPARKRPQDDLQKALVGFANKLAGMKILDPACGSGNFLYVALKQLMDLEKEVITFAATNGLSSFFPQVKPEQLYGIEINPYAHELAQIVVWIGYIQWLHDNGFGISSSPVLRPLHNILHMDAVLAVSKNGSAFESMWPQTDVIIGNPPFLGGGKIRSVLGNDYVDTLFGLYGDRLPNFSDLVCYWFEKARAQIEHGQAKRAGLLATQGIRGGANRTVLARIKDTGNIFWAQSDRDWILDGATVHVSMVAFDDGTEHDYWLDGRSVSKINSDLTSTVDLTIAERLKENHGICFMGPSAKAPLDIEADVAKKMLDALPNPNGCANSVVVRPVASAVDLVQRSREKWTIDFAMMGESEASLFEMPFEYVRRTVYPVRLTRRDDYRGQWWQYARPRPEMRLALEGKIRFLSTPSVAKYRIFVWVKPEVLCNQGTLVFARDDDYFFGIMHSKVHELWARGTGTQLREAESGFRYTPTSTFETFPLPWPPGQEPIADPRVQATAEAACDLVEKRDKWLNPESATETELKKRTLTNLYNQRPAWLDHVHRRLDDAVLDAYGWPHDLSDQEILARLLTLNLERAAK